ncbi:MAG: hypothetical protein ACRD38_01415 [Nitrososphaerales archaeon]
MDFQALKTTHTQEIFTSVVMLLIVLSIITFLEKNPDRMHTKAIRDDNTLMAAMDKLSKLVPDSNILLSSKYAPIVTYFTGHTTKIPYGVSSKEALINYMLKRDYNYLVVFEGKSSVKELESLFSSKGLRSLDSDFERVASYTTELSKIHLYKLNVQRVSKMNLIDNVWKQYIIDNSKIADFDTPDISTIRSIKIKIADDGSGSVSVWLGSLSLVDEHGNEFAISDFQSGHGFTKLGGSGTQIDDTVNFVLGTQSLNLKTEGDGLEVVTRKSARLPSIDFTETQLKLWIKISDVNKLGEFRITVIGDDFVNYGNYWIQKPSKV